MPHQTVTTEDGKGNVVETRTVEIPQEQANRDEIERKARAALVANAAYVAKTTPLATDNIAQIKALTRQNNGIIRLLLNALESTE